MSNSNPKYYNSKELNSIRFYSKKIDYHKTSKASSPTNLKLAKSFEDLMPRCISPTLALKKSLTEIITELSTNSNILQKTKLAYKALKICSEEESSYTKEMKSIVEIIKSSIFIDKSSIDPEILSYIYEKYLDAIIDKDQLVYLYVVEGYKSVLDKFKKENLALKTQLTSRITERKEEIKEKKIEIAKLKAKIEMDLTEPLKLKEAEIRNLEDKNIKNLKNIEELRNIITEKDDVIKKFKSQSSVHSRVIYEYQCIDEENKIKIKELNENLTQSNTDLRKFQDESYRKQHNLEIALFKLKSAIEKEKDMENRIRVLEQQNVELSYRAGIGFENLTPRPSFVGIENLIQEIPKSSQKKVEKLIEVASLLSIPSKSSTSIKKKTRRASIKNLGKWNVETNSEQGDM